MDSKMDDDDYYVDHYDCPQQQQQLQQSTIISSTNQSISNSRKLSTNSTKTKASVSKMDDNDSIIEFVSANNTPSTPKSSDLISNTSSLKNDDEPYEYDDDYLDKFFSISSTPPPVAVATVATDTISTVSSDLIHDDKQQTTSDMNETTLYEKYLSDIWQQLNVGHDGYLTMDELYRVCEHIGMTIQSDQMIEQLFDKLDSDQDGRVSLAEFVDGLFKYLHDQPATTSPTNSVIESLCYNNQNNNQTIISNESSSLSSLDNDIEDYESNNINENVPLTSLNNKHFKLNHNFSHHYQRNNICNNNQSSPSSSSIQLSSALSIIYNQLASYSNFFTIKHDKDGYTDSGTLIDLWESFGFNNEENNDNIDDNSRLNIEDSLNNDHNFNNQKKY